jgi:hypothetical protein
MNEQKKYIRAKQWLPQINFLYCNSMGHILENQSKPIDGIIEDNMSSNEIMEEVRKYRNKLLTECDWTQLNDVPLDALKVNEWRTYRQNLRDFPSLIEINDWTGPEWPTPPS